MCAPEPQTEAGEPSNKSWVVYQLSNLNSIHIWSYLHSPHLPLSAVTRLVECYRGNGRELSDWLRPSLSLNYGFAAEIANQPLRSAGEEDEIVWIYFD